MRLTYKSLYQQVTEIVDKGKTYNTKSSYGSQLSTSGVIPSSASGAGEVNLAGIIASMQSFLSSVLPATIKEGLLVTATDPVSASVNISAGSGSAGGYFYTLEEDLVLPLSFDDTSAVYFINLFEDSIQIEKNQDSKKLTIAKVVVPSPGVTSRIIDTKDGSLDAYIINYQEYRLHGDGNGNFEEDTLELFRQNIGPVLADNIIGNIRLSQDLIITNTQGTLELDSNELRILNLDGSTLAKFTRLGTFYYDENGIETAHFSTDSARFGDFDLVDGEVRITNQDDIVAKFTKNGIFFYDSSGNILSYFTTTGAKIGNIEVLANSIQSSNFIEDVSGFRLQSDGNAEFENVRVRGAFHTSIFVKDTVSALGGIFIVAEADTLDADMTALDSSTLTTKGDVNFAVGDILRIKDADNDEWFQVTDISSAPTYTVQRDKEGFYTSNNNPVWTAGAAVVNYRQSGDGYIYMTASDETAPYISVITQSGTPWVSQTERLRLGRLDGFLDYPEEGDSDYTGPYYGIAIGELTKYLKYDPDGGLVIRGNLTMDSGFIGGAEGWQIVGNEIIGSTHSSIRGGQTGYAEGAGFFMGYDDGSGALDAYKFSIGDLSNYVKWDGFNLYIRGSLIMGPGSTIESGIISADAFVDTVVGDLSIGAVFAKTTLQSQIKWTQFQTQAMLQEPTATYDTPSGETFETAEGVLAIPTADRWDESGLNWDETGLVYDGTSVLGTYIFTSEIKDIGANFNNMPILVATKQITTPNTVSVEISYSEDNVTWSDYESAYPSDLAGVTTWYMGNIVLARYLKYKITFVITDGTSTTYLSNIYFKALAVYKTVIFPDTVFYAVESREISGLDNYFSKEYSVSLQAQGTSLVRSQIVSKSSPPSTLSMRLVNDSNAAVDGTADITLIGY